MILNIASRLSETFFFFFNYSVHPNTVIWKRKWIFSFAFDRCKRQMNLFFSFFFWHFQSPRNRESMRKIERGGKNNLQIYNIYIYICTSERAGWKVRRQFSLLSQFLRARHTTGQIFGIPTDFRLQSLLAVVFVRYPRRWTRHIDLKTLLNTCDRSYHRHFLLRYIISY